MQGKETKIIRLQDCKIYPSISAAARDIGADKGSVCRAVKRSGSCKGWQVARLPEELATGVDIGIIRLWANAELIRRGGRMVGDTVAMNGGIIL